MEESQMKEISVTANAECSQPARRSFIKKSGVALSAALAATVAGSATAVASTNTADELARRLGALEDANAVREVYRAYESAINQERYEDAVNLFAANSEVSFGGGVFTGKDKGVRLLYMETFRQGHTGKKLEMPEQLTANMASENIETALDRKSARAVFPYSMRVGTPMDASLQLVQMARIQGGGIEYRRESGNCEVSFVKEGESWKISRIEYRPI
jgi:hypothetical protein